jgi:DNA-directed RNA polymerase specialized sigma24 family protein
VQTGTPSSDVVPAAHSPFESLFSGVAQAAYGVAMRLTRNQADAEDLLQDAALLAHRQKLGTERIVDAISRLPEEYRIASTLYFMEDLS